MNDYEALLLTLKLAGCTTCILAVTCLPLAYWLVMTTSVSKNILENIVLLPLILPPTVLGFYILWLTGQQSMIGKYYHAFTGASLPFTFTGILIGSVIFNLPFALRPFISALESVERKYLEAAWCLGAGPWKTFIKVVIPICWPGLLVGIFLPFAHSLGEFGVVLMLGGNIPGVTRTLSLVIYDEVQSLDYQSAHHTACLLLMISILSITLLQFLSARRAFR